MSLRPGRRRLARPSRRRILGGGLALGVGALGWLGTRGRPTVGVPFARTRGPDAVPPFLTPIDSFYRYSNGPPPAPQGSEATVSLGRSVAPRSFTWSDLLPLADRTEVVTLQCDGNGYKARAPSGCQVLPDETSERPEPQNWPWRFGGIGTAEWDVVSVADLYRGLDLPRAGPWLRIEGRDGYRRYLPSELAAQLLVAVGMNGVPLPHAHGAPARLLEPGQYGAMNVKWLRSLTFGEHDDARPFDGGAETEYPIKPLAFARTPLEGAVIEGVVELGGAAFEGARAVKEVVLWIDPGQPWTAELLDPGRPGVWSRWTSSVRLPRGVHTVTVCCVDAAGRMSKPQQPWGDAEGYGGYHRLRVEVV